MKIRINWEKAGAYAFGGLLGGGLSALAWHLAEKNGFDPGMIFRKKVLRGNVSYYDPEKDPAVAEMMSEVDEEDEDDDEFESDEEEVEDGEDGGTDGINEPRIYQIDRETWYRSEDDEGYKHAEMKYWIDDQQVSDEMDVKIPKPWLLIGDSNYDALSDENAEREMFVRNEELETDYCITRTEGSYE